DIHHYIRTCRECQQRKKGAKRQPLQGLGSVDYPFQHIYIDLLKLPRTTSGNIYLLAFQDHFSKYVEAAALPTKETRGVAKALIEQVILRHGVPDEILTDQGTEFTSAVVKDICALLG